MRKINKCLSHEEMAEYFRFKIPVNIRPTTDEMAILIARQNHICSCKRCKEIHLAGVELAHECSYNMSEFFEKFEEVYHSTDQRLFDEIKSFFSDMIEKLNETKSGLTFSMNPSGLMLARGEDDTFDDMCYVVLKEDGKQLSLIINKGTLYEDKVKLVKSNDDTVVVEPSSKEELEDQIILRYELENPTDYEITVGESSLEKVQKFDIVQTADKEIEESQIAEEKKEWLTVGIHSTSDYGTNQELTVDKTSESNPSENHTRGTYRGQQLGRTAYRDYNKKLAQINPKAYKQSESVKTDMKNEDKQVAAVPKAACYIATAVYGSYDCPQVWTLRRYRDYKLSKTWGGRLFIYAYYAISPLLVKMFGDTRWFKKFFGKKLDHFVKELQDDGYKSTPYSDPNW